MYKIRPQSREFVDCVGENRSDFLWFSIARELRRRGCEIYSHSNCEIYLCDMSQYYAFTWPVLKLSQGTLHDGTTGQDNFDFKIIFIFILPPIFESTTSQVPARTYKVVKCSTHSTDSSHAWIRTRQLTIEIMAHSDSRSSGTKTPSWVSSPGSTSLSG